MEHGSQYRCSLFVVDDDLQPLSHVLHIQWRETEARAAGLQRRDDLADVVADQAEACALCVLLDHCRINWILSARIFHHGLKLLHLM